MKYFKNILWLFVEKISKIRTDLNKFTKDEAGLLMAFGYSLTKENSFLFKSYLKKLEN